MNPEKIGPHHPPIEPTSIQPPGTEEIQIKPTHLKEHSIPSAASHQTELPNQQVIESSLKVEGFDTLSHSHIEAVEAIDTELEIVASSIHLPRRPITSIVNKRMHEELENLIERESRRHSFNSNVDAIVKGAKKPTQLIHFAMAPYHRTSPLLDIPEHIHTTVEGGMLPVKILSTALDAVELVGRGSDLLEQAAHVGEANQLLEEKKTQLQETPNDKELQSYVKRLNNYLKVQKDSLRDKIIDFSIDFAGVSLESTRFVVKAAESFVLPFVKTSLGWALSFLDVVSEIINFWRVQEAKSTHEVWMVKIREDQHSLDQAEKLLEKRQERMILNKAEQFSSFESLKKSLGVDLEDKNINSFDEFKALLADPHFNHEIAKNFLKPEDEKEDTILALTRNGLQSLAEAKVINEKKFFDFKLNVSKASLTFSCLSVAVAVSLEALAISGVVVLALSTLAIPGLGFFALGIILGGLGLYFFHKHKPNLFQCYMRGVNLQLLFLKIPASIRSLQLMKKRKEIKALEMRGAHYIELEGLLRQKETLDHISYPKSLQKTLQKLQQDTARKIDDFERMGMEVQREKVLKELAIKRVEHQQKLDDLKKEEEEIDKKMEFWTGKEGKVTKLQNELREAGNKDFELANRLIDLAKDDINIPTMLARSMLQSHFELDEETLLILKEKMGFDLAEMAELLKEENLIEKLKEYFKMDDSELLAFMKQQLRNLQDEKYKAEGQQA